MRLLSYKKGESTLLSEEIFSIRVLAEAKKASTKKSKKTKNPSSKKSLLPKIIPEVQAEEVTTSKDSSANSQGLGFGLLLFTSGLAGAYFLKRKKNI